MICTILATALLAVGEISFRFYGQIENPTGNSVTSGRVVRVHEVVPSKDGLKINWGDGEVTTVFSRDELPVTHTMRAKPSAVEISGIERLFGFGMDSWTNNVEAGILRFADDPGTCVSVHHVRMSGIGYLYLHSLHGISDMKYFVSDSCLTNVYPWAISKESLKCIRLNGMTTGAVQSIRSYPWYLQKGTKIICSDGDLSI